jgi:hypothetical protein
MQAAPNGSRCSRWLRRQTSKIEEHMSTPVALGVTAGTGADIVRGWAWVRVAGKAAPVVRVPVFGTVTTMSFLPLLFDAARWRAPAFVVVLIR